MCGITGIFSFNPVGRIHLVHLEEATRRLASRGPDVHNTWFDDRVGLGHRRLSIIDTSQAGDQPMTDSTGRYTIIFNGEIYNFRELKGQLNSTGYRFRSASDTEVLLCAYMHWGPDCLERLNGFFAFAIYDREEDLLFLARDRYGIKPLLYYVDDDKFLFASEMKSLVTYGIPKKLDQEALSLYFQLTYIPPPLSIFTGVRKLLPGHCITVSTRGIHTRQYYDLPVEAPWPGTYGDAQNQLVHTLRKAVHDRLMADVPLGAFLSGGVDSSVVVALASEQVKDFKTFSIGFKGNRFFDETRYAALVAEKYKTDHHVFTLSNDDLLNGLAHAVAYLDEPFADSSALPVHILSRETRKHVTVALSGDGADELFAGYNKHSAWLRARRGTLPNRLVAGLSGLWSVLPKSRNSWITNRVRQLDRFARMQRLSLKERYWFLAAFVEEAQVDLLLKPLYRQHGNDYRQGILSGIGSGGLNEVLAADVKMVLAGDMLTKVDLMSMANSLEVRVPFLDPAVVRLAFSMPEGFKAHGGQAKRVLRDAFRSYLPPELYTRPKHGFEVPLLGWFRKEMRPQLEEMVFDRERIEAQGIFDWETITRIRRKLFSVDSGDAHIMVWSLYVFQCWYSRHMPGSPQP